MNNRPIGTPPIPSTQPGSEGYRIKSEDWGFKKSATNSQKMAALSTRSAMTATTFKSYTDSGNKLEVIDLIGELRKAGEEVSSGNLSRVEGMLTQQALTLDAIFNNLAQQSQKQDTFKGIEVLLRLALKAQAQSRSTVEAIALLKNPMPYIRQANIAHGHQQVNNAYEGSPKNDRHTGAKHFQSAQNKLLEADHGQWLDGRATSKAGGADSYMAAVDTVHRPVHA